MKTIKILATNKKIVILLSGFLIGVSVFLLTTSAYTIMASLSNTLWYVDNLSIPGI